MAMALGTFVLQWRNERQGLQQQKKVPFSKILPSSAVLRCNMICIFVNKTGISKILSVILANVLTNVGFSAASTNVFKVNQQKMLLSLYAR